VRGTTNVRVNDASLLPDAPGVNPQASVMAVAIRNARRFIESVKR
jgi:choline dehydrogenase-like flavoprotein